MDTVLRLYGEEPEGIPLKGRIGKLSPYFGRAEMSRRCRDAPRECGTVKADDIAVQAMRDKGLPSLTSAWASPSKLNDFSDKTPVIRKDCCGWDFENVRVKEMRPPAWPGR
ncbi:MAG TPA: hypothetical protein VIJ72_06065, partial [Rhizomicrobium sp.]